MMKKLKKPINLSVDEALVLQQISERGEDDLVGLARGLRMNRQRVVALLTHLKRLGLVRVTVTYGDWWVVTSRRGAELVSSLWPEMRTAVY